MLNRRHFLYLAGTAAAMPALPALPAFAAQPATAADFIAQDLDRYINFGSKASGGQGDNASGAWILAELEKAGYAVEASPFDVPYFTPVKAALQAGDTTAQLIPQAVVIQTPATGLAAKLSYVRLERGADETGAWASLTPGTIALIDLPKRHYSSSDDALIIKVLAQAEQRGAAAIVLITNGPTGEAVALNAPLGHALFSVPTAVLSPQDKAAFVKAAENGTAARLTLTGEQGTRTAFNAVGRLVKDPALPTVVLSTPRSGWLTCAAERAPGVAVWLDLARWAAAQDWPFNLFVMATSGHEYENAGILHQISKDVPAADRVPLWLLYGAGTATRHSVVTDGKLEVFNRPADVRRILLTPTVEGEARAILSGWDGWTDPIYTHDGGAGEVGSAMRAGYPHVVGFAGSNPLHHTASDTGSLVDAGIARKVAHESRGFLTRLAARPA